jgi:predicted kinase
MSSKLVNVRLDPQRAKKAARLREHGIALSDLVRQAIDAGYERIVSARKPGDTDALLDSLFERFPDSPAQPQRTYNVHDAKAARAAIRARLAGQT